jgi:hypothetical protein
MTSSYPASMADFQEAWDSFTTKLTVFVRTTNLENNIYNAFGQVAVTPKVSLQAELRHAEQDAGDVDLRLGELDPSFREVVNQDSVRIGAHYQPTSNHDLLASFIYNHIEGITDINFDTNDDSVDDVLFHVKRPNDGYSGEIQHLFRGDRFKTVSGIGYSRLRDRLLTNERALPGSEAELQPPREEIDHPDNIHAHSYVPISLGLTATLTLGASYDSFHTMTNDAHQFNPKFGLMWNVLPSTTLRAAAFRVLRRSFVTNQTLEPTQLAGFNQFFDDLDGTDSTRYGVGVDQQLANDLYGGFELSWRDLTRDISGSAEDQEERLYRGYLNWASHSTVALSAEYGYEEFERGTLDRQSSFSDLPELRTHYLPLRINYFLPSGFFAKLGVTYVHQEATGTDFSASDEGFWVADTSVGYRLPKRYGLVSLDVSNLFDEEFSYQNSFNMVEQQAPRFQPSRAVLFRINLWYF